MWAMDAIGRAASGIASWSSPGVGVKLRVDQHNVMQAARLVADESAELRLRLKARLDGLVVDPVGGDPVSAEAARVLNLKFWDSPDSYYRRCLEYADMLETLARQLAESARTYGHNEDQIESILNTLDS